MLNNIQEQFENLSLREKFLTIIVILTAIGGSWEHFFYQSIIQRQNTLKQQINTLDTQKYNQKQAAVAIKNRKNIDNASVNINNEDKLINLKTQYEHQQELILFDEKKFIPASLMAKALGDILNENKNMKLTQLQSLPTIPLLEVKQQNMVIYQHGLVITFSGNYLDTVNYLKALEALPWAISWESINYQVKDHPLAEITIHLVTLSFDKNWLGV